MGTPDQQTIIYYSVNFQDRTTIFKSFKSYLVNINYKTENLNVNNVLTVPAASVYIKVKSNLGCQPPKSESDDFVLDICIYWIFGNIGHCVLLAGCYQKNAVNSNLVYHMIRLTKET